MFTVKSTSAEETMHLGETLARVVEAGTVIRLDGNLGAGKTTFVKGFAKALGLKRPLKSPTYTIVKEYDLNNFILYHIDAYRLETALEDDIDMAQFITEDAVTFIEWAEFVEDYLPESYILISFTPASEEGREISVSLMGQGNREQTLIENWQKEIERV